VRQTTLRAARKKKRLTQKQLSALTGIHQARLSRLENGRVMPEYTTLRKLEEVLRVRLLFGPESEGIQ
jgi:transcriptional regulator with XRE-family HTH domain